MVEAIDVARYLLRLAADEQLSVTPTHLQNLLYYAQGWHLAVFGEPLFAGRMEAGEQGPVLKEVARLAGGADTQVSRDQVATHLDTTRRAFLESFWEEYRSTPAEELGQVVRREAPWLEARRVDGVGGQSGPEITHQSLQASFSPRLVGRVIPGLPAAEAYKAVEDLGRGLGRSREDVFARLRQPS